MVLITPGEQCTYADVYEWQPRVGRPFTYPLFAAPGGKHLEPVRLHEAGLANGARVWPQVTPRPLTMQFTLADRVQPQHRAGVRRADEGEPRRCASPRTAIPSGGRWPRPTSSSRR